MTTTEDAKKIKKLLPILDEDTGNIRAYAIHYEDDTSIEVLLDDPALTAVLPSQKFFIREIKKGDFGEGKAHFELSPVDDSMGVNKIIVQVSTELPNGGGPDPRYEHIVSAVSRQKHDFMQLTLGRDLVNKAADGSEIYKVLKFRELDDKDYTIYFNEDVKAWKQTDSKVKKDFTYTESLQQSCDIHGQWRIAESHFNTLQVLRKEPEQFQRFLYQAKKNILSQKEEDLFLEEKKKLGVLDIEPMEEIRIRGQVKQLPEYKNLDAYISDERNLPSSLEQLLKGEEVEQENGELKYNNTMYDLDLPLKKQFTPTTGLSSEDADLSTQSQTVNYYMQIQLRQRMLDNSKLTRTFLRANMELVDEGIIPISDPYRQDEEFLMLNQEYSEMIGSNIIAATMSHLHAKPNQFMKGFEPGEAIDRLLHNVDYEESIKHLDFNGFLDSVQSNVGDVITTHKSNLLELVETEAYAPGKSPRAKKEQQLLAIEEKVKNAALTGAVGVSSLEHALDDNTAGLFSMGR